MRALSSFIANRLYLHTLTYTLSTEHYQCSCSFQHLACTRGNYCHRTCKVISEHLYMTPLIVIPTVTCAGYTYVKVNSWLLSAHKKCLDFDFVVLSRPNLFILWDCAGRENACEKTSYMFLRKELAVRLANTMREVTLLPDNLVSQPSVQLVQTWWVLYTMRRTYPVEGLCSCVQCVWILNHSKRTLSFWVRTWLGQG